jgi:ureidoacrylate peracid hydrolase
MSDPKRRMSPTGDRTALLVIDMQNAFCRDQGSMANFNFDITMLKGAIEPCRRLVAAARASAIPIIYTRILYEADYRDGGLTISHIMPEMVGVKSLAAGTWDIEIIDELKPAPGEYVVDKNRFSAFYAPELEKILKTKNIDSLVVCGVTTNCCVESTVRDAFQRNYKSFVVKDAVGELNPQQHEFSLRTMEFLFADLVTVHDIVASWNVGRQHLSDRSAGAG